MAHFRAVIRGGRGEASRLGHKSTGLYGRFQTWGHDVTLYMRHDEQSGEDWLTVDLVPHNGGGHERRVLDVNMSKGVAFATLATVPAK
jgi:hypothetical protein